MIRSILFLTLLALVSPAPGAQGDECADALAITNGLYFGSTVGATSSPGGLESDVWFAYEATCSGAAVASFCGGGFANYDTAISAYIGSCGSLTPIAFNDDSPCGLQSEMPFTVVAGQTYYLSVGGFGGATGEFSLYMACVPHWTNDECSGATPIVDGITTGTNFGATPSSPGNASDVWYSYEAPCTGQANISYCVDGAGASIDTQLSVYSGTCGALSLLAANDDSCGELSDVTFNAFEGETYYISAGGSEQGSFTFFACCGQELLSETGMGGDADFTRVGPGADFVEGSASARITQNATLLPQSATFDVSLPPLPAGAVAVSAYASWSYLVNCTPPETDTIEVNGGPVIGERSGIGNPDLCWGKSGAVAYFAQIPLGDLNVGGLNSVSGCTDKALGADPYVYGEGISILVVYETPGDPLGVVKVWEGYVSTENTPTFFAPIDLNLGFEYSSGDLRLFLNGIDGQDFADEFLVEGTSVGGVLSGTSSALNAWGGTAPGPNIDNNLWDVLDDDISAFVTGPTSSLSVGTQSIEDCLGHSIAAVGFDLNVAPIETVRLGTPPNPNVLLPGVTSAPKIGAVWDPVIDHSAFLTDAIIDLIAIRPGPENVFLPGLGTLLCDLNAPPLVFSSAPGVPFAVVLPATAPQFVGLSFCSQGVSASLTTTLLTNALDFTIGTP